MATIKKSTFNVDNGTDFDTHYFKTSADQVELKYADGTVTNLQEHFNYSPFMQGVMVLACNAKTSLSATAKTVPFNVKMISTLTDGVEHFTLNSDGTINLKSAGNYIVRGYIQFHTANQTNKILRADIYTGSSQRGYSEVYAYTPSFGYVVPVYFGGWVSANETTLKIVANVPSGYANGDQIWSSTRVEILRIK